MESDSGTSHRVLNATLLAALTASAFLSMYTGLGVREVARGAKLALSGGKEEVRKGRVMQSPDVPAGDVILGVAALRTAITLLEMANGGPLNENFAADWTIFHTDKLPYFAAATEYLIGNVKVLLVVFRGTATKTELEINDLGMDYLMEHGSVHIQRLLRTGVGIAAPPQVAWPGGEMVKDRTIPQVNVAFYNTYVGQLQDQVEQWIENRLDPACDELQVSGHSLGGAVACLCAVSCLRFGAPVRLVTGAAPKPGNSAFRSLLDEVRCATFVNEADEVPFLPPSVVPDFSSRVKDSTCEYVMPPGLCMFSLPCGNLMTAHYARTYILGLELFLGKEKKLSGERGSPPHSGEQWHGVLSCPRRQALSLLPELTRRAASRQ